MSGLIAFVKKHYKWIVGLIMLALLYRFGILNFKKVSGSLKNPIILFGSLGIMIIQFLVFSLRWRFLVLRFFPLKINEAFRLHQIGQFFNTFIPGGVGGDVVKALFLSSQKNIPKKLTLSSVVNDRIIGLYFMILFSFIFLFFEVLNSNFASANEVRQYFMFSLLLFLGANLGLFLIPYIPHLLGKIKAYNPIVKKLLDYASHLAFDFKGVLQIDLFLKLFASSLTGQLISISYLYFVCHQIQPTNVPFLAFFGLCCFAFMISAIPITPGGIGLGQAAFYFLFKDLDIHLAENIVIAITLLQFFTVVIGLPGWFYFLKRKKETLILES